MTKIPGLVNRLIEQNGGNAALAAKQLGSTPASLSRYRSGVTRPRKPLEDRMRSLVEGSSDLVQLATLKQEDGRILQLEDAISATLHALREEFHRSAIVSRRQEVLDMVAVLVFAHVTSIDSGGSGLGTRLIRDGASAAEAVNDFVCEAIRSKLQNTDGKKQDKLHFFSPLAPSEESFALALMKIFEKDAVAFRTLHESGRDDLINEVFSRFMSASFVDEKEMGQYLTPPEVTRFMVQVGFHALSENTKAQMLDPDVCGRAGVLLDPSCGVGSFLAESIRYLHDKVRAHDPNRAAEWLGKFVNNNVVGIDKSERMLRLATVNLGLFGTPVSRLHLANGLARDGRDADVTIPLEGRAQLILTNPPFGATYSGSDVSAFSMAKESDRIDSEILFLERYVDWVAPGGVIVTIVPDSILVNRRLFASLRALLRSRCDVEAVISLPPVTFAAAGTTTKTSVLVLRRREANVESRTFFGQAREIGYDVVTRSGQRRRVRHNRSDLPELLAEFTGERACKLGWWGQLDSQAVRWDAGFHVGIDAAVETAAQPVAQSLLVSDVASLIDDRQDPRRRKEPEFDYIEIGDIDSRTGLVGSKRLTIDEAPSRARKLVRAGDVLVSTVRPERGTVGVVPPQLDGAICSTGFAVLRCRQGLHPLALAWLLKSEDVRRQMVRHNIGIAYPAIAESTCLTLLLTDRMHLAELSNAALALDKAQLAFEEARQEMIRLTLPTALP